MRLLYSRIGLHNNEVALSLEQVLLLKEEILF